VLKFNLVYCYNKKENFLYLPDYIDLTVLRKPRKCMRSQKLKFIVPRHRERFSNAAWPSCKKYLSNPTEGSTALVKSPVKRSSVIDLN